MSLAYKLVLASVGKYGMEKGIESQLLLNIKLLSSNSEAQRDYLRKAGSYPSLDELALEFDDVYTVFKNRSDVKISAYIVTKLDQINSALNFLSNSMDKSVWDEDALDTDPWIEIRGIAASIINEIN